MSNVTASYIVRPERPDHPQVAELLEALDAYLASLYDPEDNHILDVEALLAPEVDFLVVAEDVCVTEAGRWPGPVEAARGMSLLACGATRRMAGEPQTGGEPFGEVKRMYVRPEVRGQRLAERLLQALEARLRVAGLRLATLETGRDQTEAIRLYERCGYVRRGPFAGYPDNGLSVFYEKRLA